MKFILNELIKVAVYSFGENNQWLFGNCYSSSIKLFCLKQSKTKEPDFLIISISRYATLNYFMNVIFLYSLYSAKNNWYFRDREKLILILQ